MSTEHVPESTDHPTDRHDDRTYPVDDALPLIETDESAGWRKEYAGVYCDPSPDPDEVIFS